MIMIAINVKMTPTIIPKTNEKGSIMVLFFMRDWNLFSVYYQSIVSM